MRDVLFLQLKQGIKCILPQMVCFSKAIAVLVNS